MDGSSQFNFWGAGGNITLQLAHDVSGLGARGQKVNLVLSPADVQTPAELDTYLAGYRNAQYRADEASKPVLVDRDNDYYRTFGSNNVFRRTNVKSSINASIPEITPESSTTQYAVVDRMIGGYVPDVVQNQAERLYDVRRVTSRLCSNAIMLDREIDVWTMLTTTANWNAANHTTLGATAAWGTATGPGSASDPLRDLENRIVASAMRPNGIWFNERVALSFIRHPSVVEHLRATLGDGGYQQITGAVNIATQDNVGFTIPGFPPFYVASAKVLNETSGLLEYILGNHTVLTVSPPGVPMSGEDIATTHTFRRRGQSGTGFQTREFRIENRGLGGTMLVVNAADVAKMTGPNVGGLIRDCFQ
ncbi:MAG TPA: hypothetical protein VFB99_12860 [Vicinamibacterales bacterium]|nr:hypothetical protein [Vicinamibacterales bacterium]